MRVCIAGAGAIGIAVGACLAYTGNEVIFYARGTTEQAIREKGVRMTGILGELTIPKEKVKTVLRFSDCEKNSIDFILVCAKTLANDEISRLLSENREILKENGKIVVMQNGWGNDIPYRRYFKEEEVYLARVITGFQRTEPSVSNITVHNAPVLLGSLYGCSTDCMEELAAGISGGGLPCETTNQLSEALWAKMLYNTTLNPLGAILHVPYGALAACDSSKEIMDRLIEETYKVMDAYGYVTFWKNAEEYKKVFYESLVPNTAKHRASTLQDIEKKQKTEIHTLNGILVKMAQEKGFSVPTHETISDLILSLEAQF